MKDLAGKGQKRKKFIEEIKYHEWYIWKGHKYVFERYSMRKSKKYN